MNWNEQISQYCERTSPDFWAEPLNAISNFAIFCAGLWGFFALARKKPNQRLWWHWALCFLACITGFGSFLFHTYATQWARLADIVPIMIFMGLILGYTLRHFLLLSRLQTLVLLTGFFAIAQLISRFIPKGFANGSISYVHAIVALALISWILSRRRHPRARDYTMTTLVFAISLVFRTIDQMMCVELPLGTHFVWHVLNGLVIFLLLRASLK